MDNDGSGSLDEEEWITWWLRRASSQPNPAKQQEVIARNTFSKFDFDGSNTISGTLFGRRLSCHLSCSP